MDLILASGSPRRRELMTAAGYRFTVSVSDVNEDLPDGIAPAEGVRILAERKARAVANALKKQGGGCQNAAVIGADTLVELDGVPLGKPKDEADAAAMLRALSGSTHRVVTGVAVVLGDRVVSQTDTTEIVFRPLSDGEIADYVASGAPMDKAGAYGIQGKAGEFVSEIRGALDNVIGLPCALVAKLLREVGYPVPEKTES